MSATPNHMIAQRIFPRERIVLGELWGVREAEGRLVIEEEGEELLALEVLSLCCVVPLESVTTK